MIFFSVLTILLTLNTPVLSNNNESRVLSAIDHGKYSAIEKPPRSEGVITSTAIIPGEKNPEITKLLKKLSVSKEDTVKVDILIRLAQLSEFHDINKFERFSREALDLSEKINYPHGIAYGKYYLGSVFINYDFDYTEKLAIESYHLALKIKDSLLIARIYNLIGNLKSNVGEKEASLSNFQKALVILEKIRNDSMAAGIYNNIGNYYSEQLKERLSFLFYHKAVAINKRTGNYEWLAVNYSNMGNEFLRLQKVDSALEYFNLTLKTVEERRITRLLPSVFLNMGRCYLATNHYKKAKENAFISLSTAKAQLDRLNEKCALDLLNDIYFKTGHLDSAYMIQKEIIAVNDSIYTYSKLKELNLMELKYKYEEDKKQKELAGIRQKNLEYKKEIRYAIGLASSMIILLTLLVLYFNQKSRINKVLMEQKQSELEKENLSKELDYKKKELTTNLMYLLRKNELISNISDELKQINSSDEVNNKALQDIILELNKNIQPDLWAEFEMRFKEVHVDFYNNLTRLFPDLTPNELKLCAFLRLNMTSKDIGTITYQSVESIKVARYRLRKKLGLSRDENLISFLTQL